MVPDRSYCAKCAMKHVGQAAILANEMKQGYPHHYWIALSHLAEAGDELVARSPELAEDIRAARKEWEDDVKKEPNFIQLLYAIAEEANLIPEIFDEDDAGDAAEHVPGCGGPLVEDDTES